MATSEDDSLTAGGAALAAGEWSTARAAFEAVLEQHPTAEATLGLGSALWWLGETTAAVRRQEQAYAEFLRRPEPGQAAAIALSLCLTYGASLGNHAAASGWAERLARLVERYELAPLAGWASLCRAAVANASMQPTTAATLAREAVDSARRFADADLELCALSELGTALMLRGQTREGVALLDESMAGALGGEAVRPETVVFTGCRTIVCCSRTFDVTRAVQWIRAGDDFTRRYGGLHLYTVCRVEYGTVLYGLGRWEEADEELNAALRTGRDAERALYGEALASLAELRLTQGRVAEAARLLEGFEDHPATAVVRAMLHLTHGRSAVAAEILQAQLAGLAEPCLKAARAMEVLVEAETAQGLPERALPRARELAEMGDRARCDAISARGERALGIVHAAQGDEAAVTHLRRAIDLFARCDMPYDSARAHLLLARCTADREVAVAEARTALTSFERVGATPLADAAAALMRTLGENVARGGHRPGAALTAREQEVLALLGEGLSNRQLAERLVLSRKTIEHHVASVLAKLGLDNRAVAAAYVARRPRQDGAG